MAKPTKTKTTKAKPTKARPKAKPTKKGAPKPKQARALKKSSTKLKPPASVAVPPAPDENGTSILDRLFSVVSSRRGADPMLSHSARLLSRGSAKVAQKFGEEAVECLIEAIRGDHRALVAESADVLYHLIVMWVDADVQPEEVWAELRRREGISGIAERAARVRALPLAFGVHTNKIP